LSSEVRFGFNIYLQNALTSSLSRDVHVIVKYKIYMKVMKA